MGIDKKSYFYVVLIQVIYVGYYILTKSAYNGGTNNFVFVFYRQFLATLILVPFAILFERKKAPTLTIVVFCKISALSFFGATLTMNLFEVGLLYTSTTLTSAITNTVPVITFVFALVFRMETLKPKTVKGMAKIVGLGLSLGGAIVLAFYKGPHLKSIMHRHLLGRRSSSTATSEGRTWITGAFINLAANVVWGLWIVMQAKVLESYPSKLLLTTLQCALSAIQTFFVAIIFTRDLHPWKLHLDIGLLAIAYAGILTTAAVFYLQTCCLQRRGPVFFAMSTPLSFIFTMICSYVILGESITLGSLVGGILLVGGLYSFLWGKNKEHQWEKPGLESLDDGDEDKKEEQKDAKLVVEGGNRVVL